MQSRWITWLAVEDPEKIPSWSNLNGETKKELASLVGALKRIRNSSDHEPRKEREASDNLAVAIHKALGVEVTSDSHMEFLCHVHDLGFVNQSQRIGGIADEARKYYEEYKQILSCAEAVAKKNSTQEIQR